MANSNDECWHQQINVLTISFSTLSYTFAHSKGAALPSREGALRENFAEVFRTPPPPSTVEIQKFDRDREMRYDTTNNFSLFNLSAFFIVINLQIENAGDFFAIKVTILYLKIHEPFAINLMYLINCLITKRVDTRDWPRIGLGKFHIPLPYPQEWNYIYWKKSTLHFFLHSSL